MEYTNEFLARVYGAYIGCNARCTGGHFQANRHSTDSNGKLYMSPSIMADCHERTFRYSDLKLLLMPLSEISDEDAIEVAKMFGYKIKKGTILPDEVETKADLARVGKSLVQSFLRNAVTDTYLVWQPIIDKLRELGYDCGYGSVASLIKSGIAIKKQQP